MQNNPGKTMGDAHRSVAHDPIVQGVDPLQDLNNSPSANTEHSGNGINVLTVDYANTTTSMDDKTVDGNETSSNNTTQESEAEYGVAGGSSGEEGEGIGIGSESGGESNKLQM
jgi:hypothetical protein